MKFRINTLGEKYPMTHNIELLADVLEKLNDSPPEWLAAEAERITEYEQKSRYVMGFITSRKKIQSLLALTEELIKSYDVIEETGVNVIVVEKDGK